MKRLVLALSAAVACATPLAAQSIHVNAKIEDLEARTRTDSADAVAWYNLALGYMSHERWNDADTTLGRALALDPQMALAWLARSVVQDRNDSFWDRLKHRGVGDSAVTIEVKRRVGFERRAYLVDPFVDLTILGGFMRFDDTQHDAVAYWMGRTYARYLDGMRDGVQGLVEGDANRAYGAFELSKAAFLQSVGDRWRDSMPERLLWLHGMAAARSNHLADAAADFEMLTARTIKAEDKDTMRFSPLRTNEYRYMLAAIYQRANDGRAMNLFRDVAANDLGNYMARVQMARLYEARNEWDRAIAQRRAAADIDNDDHSTWFDLGSALARVSDLPAAESALARARELQPRDARVYYRLGLVEQRLNKNADARTDFQTFLALAPSRYAAAIADARQRIATLQ